MRLNIFLLAFVALNVAIFASAAPSNQATNVRIARKLEDSENGGNIDRRDTSVNGAKIKRDDVEINDTPLIREVAKENADSDLVARQNKIALYFWFEWCDITGNDCVGHVNLIDNVGCLFKPYGKKSIKIHRSGYFAFFIFELNAVPFGTFCPSTFSSKAQNLYNPFDGQVITLEYSNETRFSVKKL